MQYVEMVEAMSQDYSKNVHRVGDESAFMPGGFEVAALAAGGAITATEAVLEGSVANAYVLCRCARFWFPAQQLHACAYVCRTPTLDAGADATVSVWCGLCQPGPAHPSEQGARAAVARECDTMLCVLFWLLLQAPGAPC